MKIAVAGAAGRMGRMLIKTIVQTPQCDLTAGTVLENSGFEGKDLGLLAGVGALGILASSSAQEMFLKSDVVLDFTTPQSSVDHALLAAQYGKMLVIGTTGLSDEQKKQVKEASLKTKILMSPNMSVGMNVLFSLVEKTATLLDNSYDIEIVEMHHRFKKDAPSGTALELGRRACVGRNVSLNEQACFERYGQIGERPMGQIGFASLRGGDVAGEHTVIFAGLGERVELAHKASGRESFAQGAVKAALWLEKQPVSCGLYSMKEVLGL
jgi:4-hydroxy-tetrahydrodipicolinate reductase